MRPKTPRWYENLEEKSNDDLVKMRNTLGMLADDNYVSIYDGTNPTYDESDLDFWSALCLRASHILHNRAWKNKQTYHKYYEIHAPHIKPNLEIF